MYGKLVQCRVVKSGKREYKSGNRSKDYYNAYGVVKNLHTFHLKACAHLVYNICKQHPPYYCTAHYRSVSHTLFHGVVGDYERKSGKECNEQEYYQRVGERQQERGNKIVHQRTLFLGHGYVMIPNTSSIALPIS